MSNNMDIIERVRTALAEHAKKDSQPPISVHVHGDDYLELERLTGMLHVSIDGVRIVFNDFAERGFPKVLPEGSARLINDFRQIKRPRKVLYSAYRGSGWVGQETRLSKEQRRFMLEYPPFIKFLEDGGNFLEYGYHAKDVVNLPVVQKFMHDWDASFPEKIGEYPYFGGLIGLCIREAPAGARVLIIPCEQGEIIVIEGDADNDWM